MLAQWCSAGLSWSARQTAAGQVMLMPVCTESAERRPWHQPSLQLGSSPTASPSQGRVSGHVSLCAHWAASNQALGPGLSLAMPLTHSNPCHADPVAEGDDLALRKVRPRLQHPCPCEGVYITSPVHQRIQQVLFGAQAGLHTCTGWHICAELKGCSLQGCVSSTSLLGAPTPHHKTAGLNARLGGPEEGSVGSQK